MAAAFAGQGALEGGGYRIDGVILQSRGGNVQLRSDDLEGLVGRQGGISQEGVGVVKEQHIGDRLTG